MLKPPQYQIVAAYRCTKCGKEYFKSQLKVKTTKETPRETIVEYKCPQCGETIIIEQIIQRY